MITCVFFAFAILLYGMYERRILTYAILLYGINEQNSYYDYMCISEHNSYASIELFVTNTKFIL